MRIKKLIGCVLLGSSLDANAMPMPEFMDYERIQDCEEVEVVRRDFGSPPGLESRHTSMSNRSYDLLVEAQVYAEKKNWEKTFSTLEALRESDLSNSEAAALWNIYGFVFFTQENFLEAQKVYLEVLKVAETSKTYYQALYSFAQASVLRDDYCGAWEAYKVWENNPEPKGPGSWNFGSQLQYFIGDFEGSREYLSKAFELSKPDKGQEFFSGKLNSLLNFIVGKYDDAASIAVGLAQQHDNIPSQYFAAYVYSEHLNNASKAVELLSESYKKGKLTSDTHLVGFAEFARKDGNIPLSCEILSGVNDLEAYMSEGIKKILNDCH